MERPLDIASLYLVSSHRIRAVKHHNLNTERRTCLHYKTKSADESIRANSDILNIIDNDIYILEHLGCRLASRAIKRIHWKACRSINRIADLSSCIHIAAHTVFRTIKSNKIDSRCIEKNVDCRPQLGINTTRVGYQAHPLAFERLEVSFAKHLNTSFHKRLSCKRG